MKTYRIGNEILVKWPILTNGEAVSMSNRDLKLFLTDKFNQSREITDFETELNVISFTFHATDQKRTGLYRLTLFENIGKPEQTVVDRCNAFALVDHNNEIPDDLSPEELLLTPTNLVTAIRGKSAYEIAVIYGYQGTEQEWAEQFNTVLTSLDVMASYVERAETVAAQTEELYRELQTMQEAEQGRVQAESQRVQAEQTRESAEQQRVSNESERQTAEQQRVIADEQRQQALETAINDWNRTRVVQQTETTVEIQPNVKNIWATPVAELTITLAAGTAGYDNEYMLQFQCPANAATALNLPSTIKWANDEPSEPMQGCIYQISIIDNLAVYAEWD